MVIVALLAALASACATRAPGGSAPVEDRGPSASRPQQGRISPPVAPSTAPAPVTTAETPAPAQRVLAGAENAGKPGYYTVRPGDTLIRIGLETGQSWRDIARWNNLENPNLIEVGQVLRIIPPAAVQAAAAPVPAAASAPPASAGAPVSDGAVARPVSTPGSVTATSLPPAGAAATRTASVTPTPSPTPSAPPASASSDEDMSWIWPVASGGSSAVIARFDEVSNKGIGISGKLGDPVFAASDGRVVYAGSGLRGYGNLIILKHNNTYLSAYAHNQTLLVREDQTVRKGQKIAEMGSTDTDRVKLHFEIRKQGKPVDPLRLLPPR